MNHAHAYYLALAEEVRAARVRYAEDWLRLRLKAKSDQEATHKATAETKDELTVLNARLELARRALDRS